jgi:uncharacterized cupredoxin-like copper-binding protein
MVNNPMIRLGAAIMGVAVALTVTGCTSGPSRGPRPGMMGDGGYRYSRLTCAAPTDLPGLVVTVVLADMGMSRMVGGTASPGARMMLHAAPATVAAGQVSFVAQNMGWRTHELVVLPLASGTAGLRVPGMDGKVDETGSLGEASADCAAGTGDGIPAGAVGWVTLTLPPGTYEIVCNLTNHYADGMYQRLTVLST